MSASRLIVFYLHPSCKSAITFRQLGGTFPNLHVAQLRLQLCPPFLRFTVRHGDCRDAQAALSRKPGGRRRGGAEALGTLSDVLIAVSSVCRGSHGLHAAPPTRSGRVRVYQMVSLKEPKAVWCVWGCRGVRVLCTKGKSLRSSRCGNNSQM